jgi:L-fuculose-phosphate aldolase
MIVEVGGDGAVVRDDQRPSSEWQFHLAAYRARPDRNAVVHCHSPHAMIVACTGHGIPPIHYMVAAAGGADIPCVAYAGFGTSELAHLVAGALAHRDACLMAHHGQVSLGVTLDDALDLACIVEDLARTFHGVRQLGPVALLEERAVQDAIARMREYRAGTLNPQ